MQKIQIPTSIDWAIKAVEPVEAPKIHRRFNIILLSAYLDSLGYDDGVIFTDMVNNSKMEKIHKSQNQVEEFIRVYKEEGDVVSRIRAVNEKYNLIKSHFLNKFMLKGLRGRALSSYESKLFGLLSDDTNTSYTVEDLTAISKISTFYYEDMATEALVEGFAPATDSITDVTLPLEFVNELKFGSKRKREFVFQYWKTPDNRLVEFVVKYGPEKKAWDALKNHGKIQLVSNILSKKSIPHSNFMVYHNGNPKGSQNKWVNVDFQVNILSH
jgi:hypothetical protein